MCGTSSSRCGYRSHLQLMAEIHLDQQSHRALMGFCTNKTTKLTRYENTIGTTSTSCLIACYAPLLCLLSFVLVIDGPIIFFCFHLWIVLLLEAMKNFGVARRTILGSLSEMSVNVCGIIGLAFRRTNVSILLHSTLAFLELKWTSCVSTFALGSYQNILQGTRQEGKAAAQHKILRVLSGNRRRTSAERIDHTRKHPSFLRFVPIMHYA